MNNLYRTILFYELLAFAIWNIMVRTQSDYEMWLFNNIHKTMYIMLSSALLIATIVYVAKVIGKKLKTPEILKNYVGKLQEAGVDLGFLPNNGNDILGITDGEPEEPTGATTEGPVAAGTSTGD